MSNRQMEEMAEACRDAILARELGITVDELLQLDFEVTEEGSDDGVPYYILVQFGNEAPQEILDKIEGLEGGRSVRLDLNAFNAEE